MRIKALKQVERIDELARQVKIRKPKAQDGAVARIAGEAEGDELRLFFRGVLERIRHGIWINDKVEGIFNVMSDDKPAKEAEF